MSRQIIGSLEFPAGTNFNGTIEARNITGSNIVTPQSISEFPVVDALYDFTLENGSYQFSIIGVLDETSTTISKVKIGLGNVNDGDPIDLLTLIGLSEPPSSAVEDLINLRGQPAGGTTGQHLTKTSDTDFDSDWTDSGVPEAPIDGNQYGRQDAAWEIITGGGGSATFTGLTDTPASYTGQSGKVTSVSSGETGLEFTTNISFPEAPVDGQQYTRKDAAWDVNIDVTLGGVGGDVTNDTLTLTGQELTVSAVTTTTDGAMLSSDKLKLDGIASGATSNSTDAFLLDRANQTGTQLASTISDFDTTVSSNSSVTANTAKVSFPEAPVDGNQYTRKDAAWDVNVNVTLGGVGGDVTNDTLNLTGQTLTVNAVTTTTDGAMLASDKSKLDGVQSGATANSTDAFLLDRANQTGTQLASTISDFDTAVTANSSVTANTAKVSFPEAPIDGTPYSRQDADWVSSSTGVTTFTGLTDTPVNYTGQANRVTSVNVGETGLEFTTNVSFPEAPIDGTPYSRQDASWVSASTGATFLGLTDTPTDYTGDANKFVKVNALENALEFVTTVIPTEASVATIETGTETSEFVSPFGLRNITKVAIGNQAAVTSQGASSVAIGANSGISTQGANSVAIGPDAGKTTQGGDAVAIGSLAGSTDQGAMGIAVGESAGMTTQGINAVAVGLNAGKTTQGSSSIAIGNGAALTSQGINAVAIGPFAANNTQSARAVAIGPQTGLTLQGVSAVAVGDNAGMSNQGVESVAIGNDAGKTSQFDKAIAIGATAGNFNQGANAIAIGVAAGLVLQEEDGVHLKTPDFDFEYVPSTKTLDISNSTTDLVLTVNGGPAPTLNRTSAQLNDISDAINTTGKTTGAMVYNNTTGTPVWASGATAGSTWDDATGSVVNTPV